MRHSQHRGHGHDCDCDCADDCGPSPTPPSSGPAPLPQPCAVSVSDAFIRALLALLATPQQLATFTAFVTANATLTVGDNPTVTGIAAIQAALALPPFVATALAVSVQSTVFSGTGGGGVLAIAQVNLRYTLPGGAIVTIPATFRINFNGQCQITSITILADFSPLAPT